MKKKGRFLRLTAALVLLALLVLLPGGCIGSITGYTGKEAVQGQVLYRLSDRGKKAFASVCTWDLDPTHTSFDIAGEIEGSKVIALGGYTGTGVANPFVIEAKPARKELWTSDPALEKWEVPVTWEDLVFTVYVGKNVEKIGCGRECLYYGVETEDGIRFYRPVCYFVCDEANPTLYSKDGVLYLRKDDTKLAYQDDLIAQKEPGSALPDGGD